MINAKRSIKEKSLYNNLITQSNLVVSLESTPPPYY